MMQILQSPMGIYAYYYLAIQKLIFLIVPKAYTTREIVHTEDLTKIFDTTPITMKQLYQKLLQLYITVIAQIFGFWMLYE